MTRPTDNRPRSTRHWINTVSLDHVRAGEAGGFTQADHGSDTRLRRLAVGDTLAFYSPRTALRGGTPLQQFTAFGRISGSEPYRVTMSEDFRPWRLAVDFIPVTPADIRPLLDRLSVIKDPKRWGLVFRRGLFEVPESDMAIIARALGLGGLGLDAQT